MNTERAGKSLVAGLSAYECAAVVTGRVPPITTLCRRHRWLEAILLALLLAHLHRKARPA